jgi:hypothetical protein
MKKQIKMFIIGKSAEKLRMNKKNYLKAFIINEKL